MYFIVKVAFGAAFIALSSSTYTRTILLMDLR